MIQELTQIIDDRIRQFPMIFRLTNFSLMNETMENFTKLRPNLVGMNIKKMLAMKQIFAQFQIFYYECICRHLDSELRLFIKAHNMPFKVTTEDVYAAILVADSLGQ